MADKDFRHIVRIMNTDLDGSKPVYHALKKIKGVGVMFSNMVCKISGVDKYKKVGTISDAEIKKLDSILQDPVKAGAPDWMLNRRFDYETGEDKHLYSADLKFQKENDVKRLSRIKSNRGFRHTWGLPLRGQRTKSNFRRNKGKGMGVKRKK